MFMGRRRETRPLEDPIARGRVVDARTGRGIPGATVLVRSYPELIPLFDFRQLLTDRRTEPSRAIGKTDSSGAFKVPYERLEWNALSVVAQGYVSLVDGPSAERDLEIPMRSPSSTARRIQRGSFSFKVVDRATRSVWLDLDSARVVADSAGAEFEFIVHSVRKREFALRVKGVGGLARASHRAGY